MQPYLLSLSSSPVSALIETEHCLVTLNEKLFITVIRLIHLLNLSYALNLIHSFVTNVIIELLTKFLYI